MLEKIAENFAQYSYTRSGFAWEFIRESRKQEDQYDNNSLYKETR